MCVGCAEKKSLHTSYQDMALAVARGDPPKSIALLPFGNSTTTRELEVLVRNSLYGHLSVKSYRDVEIAFIDEVLKKNNLDHAALISMPIDRLGDMLGCDAVVFGEVVDFQRVYAGVYSQMRIAAKITIWDTRTSRQIWTDSQEVTYHEGGIPLNILFIPLLTLRTGMNIRESVKMRAIDDLARKLSNNIPATSLNNGKPLKRNEIFEVFVGNYESKKQATKILKKVRDHGFPGFLRKGSDDSMGYRVFLGEFEDRDEAIGIQERLFEAFNGSQPVGIVLMKKNNKQKK